MVKTKKAKKKKAVAAKPTTDLTPNVVIASLVVSLPLFVTFGIRDILSGSVSEASIFAMLSFFLQGMALAFFWRRIQSPTKISISILYVIALWFYLCAQALSSFLKFPTSFINLAGLGSIVIIGFLIMITWTKQSLHTPSTVLSMIMGLALALITIFQSKSFDFDSINLSLNSFVSEDEEESEELEEIISADDETIISAELEAETSEPVAESLLSITETQEAEPSIPKSEGSNGRVTMQRPDLPKREAPEREKPVPEIKETKAQVKKKIKRKPARWSYSGTRGPKYWSKLSKQYKVCGLGKEQSPVNIPSNWELRDHIRHFNRPMDYKVLDDGHGIKVNFARGIQTHIGKEAFELKQMVMRSPSEHQYEGRSFPMEIQFLHKNRKGQRSNIGILVVEGKENSEMNKILNFFPKKKNIPVKPTGPRLDIAKIFPNSLKSFYYYGSLTEPPCTEGVSWNVLNNPIEMSKDQIRKFRARYRDNSRPTQFLNHRK